MDNGRYKLMRLLGEGTFGRVLLAEDQQVQGAGSMVAVKVLRATKQCQDDANIEVNILKRIREFDPDGLGSRSVLLLDSFMHLDTNLCMVFAPCGMCLYDVLKLNNFQGFWLQDVQTMSRQVCEGLSFLHEQMGLTHTDLKPENILLSSMAPLQWSSFPRDASASPTSLSYLRPVSCDVKLIDFGNATFRNEHHGSIINTRQYRGPEVLLGAGWDEQSDVWSMACVIIELYTGKTLYPARSDEEHLAMEEITAGRAMPQRLLQRAGQAAKAKFLMERRGWLSVKPAMCPHDRLCKQPRVKDLVSPKHWSFQELVDGMLELDPWDRPTLKMALTHGFWQQSLLD